MNGNTLAILLNILLFFLYFSCDSLVVLKSYLSHTELKAGKNNKSIFVSNQNAFYNKKDLLKNVEQSAPNLGAMFSFSNKSNLIFLLTLFFEFLLLSGLDYSTYKNRVYKTRPPRWKLPEDVEGVYVTKTFQPVHQQEELVRAMLLRSIRTNRSS